MTWEEYTKINNVSRDTNVRLDMDFDEVQDYLNKEGYIYKQQAYTADNVHGTRVYQTVVAIKSDDVLWHNDKIPTSNEIWDKRPEQMIRSIIKRKILAL